MLPPLRTVIFLLALAGPAVSPAPDVPCETIARAFKPDWLCEKSLPPTRGGFSIAYWMRSADGKRLAIGKATEAKTPEKVKRLAAEVEMLRGWDHPNVVKVWDAAKGDGLFFQVLEAGAQGDLFDYLTAHPGAFADPRALLAAWRDILRGVGYLHARGKVHADLKPENVVVAADGTLKLIDFDLVKDLDPQREQRLSGTLDYLDPACLGRLACVYTDKNDVFALGVILYVLAADAFPFPTGVSLRAHLDHLRSRPYPLPDRTELTVAVLVNWCLQFDPDRRPTVDQLLAVLDQFDAAKELRYVRAVSLDLHHLLPVARFDLCFDSRAVSAYLSLAELRPDVDGAVSTSGLRPLSHQPQPKPVPGEPDEDWFHVGSPEDEDRKRIQALLRASTILDDDLVAARRPSRKSSGFEVLELTPSSDFEDLGSIPPVQISHQPSLLSGYRAERRRSSSFELLPRRLTQDTDTDEEEGDPRSDLNVGLASAQKVFQGLLLGLVFVMLLCLLVFGVFRLSEYARKAPAASAAPLAVHPVHVTPKDSTLSFD